MDYDISDYNAEVSGYLAVNNVVVYNGDQDFGDLFLSAQSAGEAEKYFQNAIEGLQILKCDANESYKIATHPLEDGQVLADMKIKNPTHITITGMCDNLRGPMAYTPEKAPSSLRESITRSMQDAINSVFNGKTYDTTQTILSLAKKVYGRLNQMLTEREYKTYTIATKGAVYTNMMLVGIDQLNDPEHLLTIPVTLRFEEVLVSNEKSAITELPDDSTRQMGGNVKEKSMIESMVDSVMNTLSYIGG